MSKVQPFHCSTSHRDPFRHGSRMGGGSKGQWLHRLEGGGVRSARGEAKSAIA